MESVAIIPARGGSKRLPGKNVRPFAGVPLLAHSIWQAQHTRGIRSCFVSTDDATIAEVAREWGASVIERPAELGSDWVGTGPVLQHALQEIIKTESMPDAVLLLQVTNPLRPLAMIEEVLGTFERSDVDCAMTVTKSHHKLGRIASGLFVPAYVPGTRSQDLDPLYYENGLVYVTRAALVIERGDVFGERIAPVETDALYALGDIDTLVDAQLAEFLFQQYRERFCVPEGKS